MATGAQLDDGVKFDLVIDPTTGQYRGKSVETAQTLETTINTIIPTLKKSCATQNAAILKNAAIFSLVSIILVGLAIYVMYAGNNGPNALWNLSKPTLHLSTCIIGGSWLGLASIALITAICRKALNIHDLKKYLEIVETKSPQVDESHVDQSYFDPIPTEPESDSDSSLD